jgi:ABC-type transport system involved in multi-copper enzyme maturation permease subunit
MSATLAATRAELTKIVSARAVWLLSGAIIAVHLLLSAANLGATSDAVAAITPAGTIEIFAGDPQPARRALIEYLVASSFQMCLFVPGVAAVIAGQEFRSGQLGQSLLAVPRRGRLIVAKFLAAAGLLMLLSVTIAAISAVAMCLAVNDWDPGLPASADAWSGQAAFLAFSLLTGLTTLAITIIARSTLIGVVVTVGLAVAAMTQLVAAVAPSLDALLPMSAGRNLLLDPAAGDLSAGPGHALVVLLLWPLVTGVLAWLSVRRRDAR